MAPHQRPVPSMCTCGALSCSLSRGRRPSRPSQGPAQNASHEPSPSRLSPLAPPAPWSCLLGSSWVPCRSRPLPGQSPGQRLTPKREGTHHTISPQTTFHLDHPSFFQFHVHLLCQGCGVSTLMKSKVCTSHWLFCKSSRRLGHTSRFQKRKLRCSLL